MSEGGRGELAVEHQPARQPLFESARILIVDDEPGIVNLLERLLRREGYTDIHSTTDPRQVVPLFGRVRPDLVVLDFHMPHLSGMAVLEFIGAAVPRGTYLPVLMLTGDPSTEARNQALVLGAKDFLTKPFEPFEARYRIRNLLHTRRLHLELQRQNALLEERVRERTRELEEAQLEILDRLVQLGEFRDDDTGHHTRRVGDVSARIAGALEFPEAEVELIRRAAPLHDVGKVGIPDALLLKTGRFTPEEFEAMKAHTTIGAKVLSGGHSELIAMAEQIALAHHERWDGTGYPRGLKGKDIPWAARIVALADFYDALSHNRPYRKAWPEERIIEAIRQQSGRHFDPWVVEAFLRIVESSLRASLPARPAPTDAV